MKGLRWNAVKYGYWTCLLQVKRMEEIAITSFAFDDSVVPHVNCVTPAEAITQAKKLPFKGRGTNYPKAVDQIIKYIEDRDPKYKDFLSCVLFLSDGQGGFPDKGIKKLIDLKTAGSKVIFYTIAVMCDASGDLDMSNMTKEIDGDHYKVTDASACKAVFLKILGV